MIPALLENLQVHWVDMPAKVTVISDDPPDLPDYVNVYDVSGQWEPRFFSDRLMDVLREIDEEVVFYLSVDKFMLNDVPEGAIYSLADYMVERENVVRCGIASHPSLRGHIRHVEEWRGLEIVECAEHKHCSLEAGVGIGHALFRRKHLLELLEPQWDIWQTEVRATEQMLTFRPDLRSVAVWPSLFRATDLNITYRGTGVSMYWHLDQLPEQDRASVLRYAPSDARWR